MSPAKETGQTKDVGFVVGVRKTFDIPTDVAWDLLFSKEGVNLWLGQLTSGDLSLDQPYCTAAGIEGHVSVFKPHSHIRLTWKRKDWENTSRVQVRVIKAKDKTTISFHQEKLLDKAQREEMKAYWQDILDKLLREFEHRISMRL